MKRKTAPFTIDKDGIIRTVAQPNPTEAETARNVKQFQELINQLKQARKPVLLLVDSHRTTLTSPSERVKGLKILEKLPYDKIAFFGAKTHVRVVGQFVITAIRKQRSIKFFKTEAEALTWLKK